jgi:hypothetical protein
LLAEKHAVRGRDALATAGETPALQGLAEAEAFQSVAESFRDESSYLHDAMF